MVELRPVESLPVKFKYPCRVVDSAMTLLEVQPGDGWRYVFTFTRVGLEQAKVLGCSNGAVLVTYITHAERYVAYPFGGEFGGEVVAPTYVMEKMKLDDVEAKMVAALLNMFLPCMDLAVGVTMYEESMIRYRA